MATFAVLPSPIDSPRSPAPFSNSSFCSAPSSIATSLLNIPSPLPQPDIPRLAIPSPLISSASSAKRPKLSLNTTTCTRTLGRGHTGLRLDTAAASSPTVLNTYRNSYTCNAVSGTASPRLSYSSSSSSSPLFGTAPRSPQLPRRPTERFQRGLSGLGLSLESSPATALLEIGESKVVPYTLNSGLKSILVNTPLATISNSLSTSTTNQTKPIKAVSFNDAPETIETKIYTARDSDIPSRSPSPLASVTSEAQTAPVPSNGSSPSLKRLLETSPVAVYALRTCHHATEDDYETDPKTPVAGRRKRQREWTWTLGPLSSTAAGESQVEEEETTEDKTDA